jgi:hypothetical protein
MRILSAIFVSASLAAVVTAQAPAPAKPAAAAARPTAAKLTGDMAQVMRAIMFPNANLIFDAQSNDPGAPPKPAAAGGGASATFASVYTGWQVVENAGIAMAEATDLILKPGRLCSNGKPAPVQRADWIKFAGALREAGRLSFEAAKTKNQDKVIEVTDKVAEACANCHEVYRDKGPAGSPARCTP